MITLSGFHCNRPEILLINSLEGRQLVNVQKDPWKVADEEDHDDRQEDDGQAVFLYCKIIEYQSTTLSITTQ